jgi:hypothetical protein
MEAMKSMAPRELRIILKVIDDPNLRGGASLVVRYSYSSMCNCLCNTPTSLHPATRRHCPTHAA